MASLCIFAAYSSASSALHATADDSSLKNEDLHALIRETAARIEEKYKGSRPEADGLVQQVEETLATDEPTAPSDDDRLTMLANKLTLMNAEAGFKSNIGGVRGAVFDSSLTGYMQRYQDLEAASTTNAEEVWRWLEMADAAQHLQWQDKREICHQRALGSARALVSREPKNAEGHALLGLALEWSDEKLTALQTALKLDPRQPLALNELLERRMEQALETAVLRRSTRLDEKARAPQELAQALFDRPLTDAEILAFEREQEELRHELTKLLTLAQERNDLTAYLKTLNLLSELRQQRGEVAEAARREPEESFETFQTRLGMMLTKSVFTVFADDALLQTALDLAADDPEATGTIMLMTLISDGMNVQSTHQRPTESHMEIIRQTSDRLVARASADDSLRAARAAEAAFVLEFAMMMVLNKEPEHLDLLLRAIHLDPFRQRTQHMLMGLCTGMILKAKDVAAVMALTQTELALLPSLQTRRTCAAAAAKLHDWHSAHRHLDACLKEMPDDLGLLNQKAVTVLRESQSRAAQKKAATYFHKIESLLEKTGGAPDQGDLKLITRNHMIFLMMGGNNDAAREELALVRGGKALNEEECQELEKLLP